jgi:hypothetical protein
LDDKGMDAMMCEIAMTRGKTRTRSDKASGAVMKERRRR